MVFAGLTPADKDAFFALLDELSVESMLPATLLPLCLALTAAHPNTHPTQLALAPAATRYFASRPEMFGNGAGAAAGKAVAASAMQHALSAAPPIPATNGWKRPDAVSIVMSLEDSPL